MKKKIGIIISIVVVLIILAAAGVFTFLYFMTDIFKSNQQLFWKYAANSDQLLKMISSENETNQRQWKETHSYTSKGDLNIAVTKETGTKEIKLGTTEKHNQTTGRTYADISLYNGEAELLKASYINSEDIYALYCKDIYEPYYIGFRSSDLDQLIEKISGSEETVTDISELGLTNIFGTIQEVTPEEKKYLLDAYSQIVMDNISEDKYTRIEKTTIQINDQEYKTVGYQLQLNQEDLRQIVISLLTKVKQDEQTITIISKILANVESMDITNVIDQIIQNLQQQTLKEFDFTICVYPVNNGITKIQVSDGQEIEIILDMDASKENKKSAIVTIHDLTNEEMTAGMQISIEKQILSNMIIYTTTVMDNQGEHQLTMNTSLGNIIDGTIENNSKITIVDNDTTVETSYYKTIQASTEEVDVQELTNSSAVIINNYPKEQLETFFENIENKIEEIIPEKVGQLNIQMTEAQDGLYYLEGIISSIFTIMNANAMPQTISVTGMTIASGLKQVVLLTNDSMNNASTSLAEQEKQSFNQKFEMYKGEEINGTLVKSLLSSIKTNNTNYVEDNDRIVRVRLDGSKIKKPDNWNEQGESDATKLSQLRDNIQAGTKYNVVIEYNTKGFVEIITIEES